MNVFIGNYKVSKGLVLAPMDGYTDYPFRMICHKFGSLISISEFISTSGSLRRSIDFNPHFYFSESERPFGYQLSGENPQKMVVAAKTLMRFAPDFFDVNAGCPDRQVVSHGAGSALLLNPNLLAEIVGALKKYLPVPISAKIRIGWDDAHRNFIDVSTLLEHCGVSFISIHARTREQAYSGSSDWNAIKLIKSNVKIPVIGNRDVRNIHDIERMESETGCDLVMIGRAAIGNPWIFSRIPKKDISALEIINTACEQLKLSVNLYGEIKGVQVFRKHLKAYLNCPQCAHIKIQTLLRSSNAEFIIQSLAKSI